MGQLDLIFFLLYQTIYVATSCIGSKRLYAYAVANFMHMILATHSNVVAHCAYGSSNLCRSSTI